MNSAHRSLGELANALRGMIVALVSVGTAAAADIAARDRRTKNFMFSSCTAAGIVSRRAVERAGERDF